MRVFLNPYTTNASLGPTFRYRRAKIPNAANIISTINEDTINTSDGTWKLILLLDAAANQRRIADL